MPQKNLFSAQQINALQRWLADHGDYDWLHMDWQDKAISKLLLESESENRLPILKAYQRLLRIIPKAHQDIAFSLLERNLHSAVQIASLSKQRFLELTGDLDQPEIMATIYSHAQLKRSQLVVQYMNLLQNNEPHVRVARI